MKEQEKSCKNCLWYAQHFFKWKSKYIPAECGHCKKRKIKNHEYKLCRYWENNLSEKIERQKSIKKTIVSIYERLNEIALVLKDDEVVYKTNDAVE